LLLLGVNAFLYLLTGVTLGLLVFKSVFNRFSLNFEEEFDKIGRVGVYAFTYYYSRPQGAVF